MALGAWRRHDNAGKPGRAIFAVDRRKPLLDSLEAQGVSLPYGCRYGGCISCAAKLLMGRSTSAQASR